MQDRLTTGSQTHPWNESANEERLMDFTDWLCSGVLLVGMIQELMGGMNDSVVGGT